MERESKVISEQDANQARLKKLFPRKNDRWQFDDLYCNRGGSVSVKMPEMPRIRLKDFSTDTLIEVLFYKIYNGEITGNEWNKLMKGIRPLHNEHKKDMAEFNRVLDTMEEV